MRIDYKAMFWNIIMYLLAVLIIFLAVQHATFFYGWPPDPNKWVEVPWLLYWFLALGGYIMLKVAHFVEKKGEIFIKDGPDIIIDECKCKEEE